MNRRRDRRPRFIVTAALAAIVAVLTSCLPSVGDQRDPAEFFPDPAAQELAAAILAEDTEKMAALIARGADVNARGINGLTMLQWAVWNNRPKELEILLEAGADPNHIGDGGNTAIHTAAFSSQPEHLRSLLAFGGDPNNRGEVTGATPLTTAVLNNTDEPVHILLDAGADPNIVDKLGDGPMHTAARTNKGWAILLMLEAGGDPGTTNSRGTSWQDFFWSYNPKILNDRSRAERRAVIAWLEERGHWVHPKADQFR